MDGSHQVGDNQELSHALKSLIRGDGVRRASHLLVVDGRDVSGLFVELLAAEGYQELQVAGIDISPGERVPAFCLKDGTAHFGWVFWEVFSSERKRKIFASQAKNARGDWMILLARSASVHACPGRRELMDADHPSSF